MEIKNQKYEGENFYIIQTDDAKDFPLPSYATPQSAGMDLYANIHKDITVHKGEIMAIPTGIKIALPPDYEAQVRARSGLAYKHGITMINAIGTVDADFRGELNVLIINLGKEAFTIKRGFRIAQMVINKIKRVQWQVVEELEATERGDGGYGHTGITFTLKNIP